MRPVSGARDAMADLQKSPGPLAGVRVLDLTTMVSGPVAAMMLGDQGADVIKVESPKGDLMRSAGVKRAGMSASFLSCNRSKRSLCVDLKRDEGLAILKALVPSCDVLLQNFRPGAIERMGLGEDVVRSLRDDIIYVSISGFGERGPYSGQRVYDSVIQALSGLADIQADRESKRPCMVRTIVPDKTTSLAAAQAVAAALFARERTGQGQHVRLAMLDVMVAYLWPEGSASLSFVGDERDPADGNTGPDLVFATKDGFITTAVLSVVEWQGMARALGRNELIEDPRFATSRALGQNRAERREITASELAKWRTDEILPRLMAEGVPCAPILERTQVLDDEQIKQNATIEEHRDAVLGGVRQPRPAARFSATPAGVRAMAPYLGADNRAILEELGYAASEIERLTQAGVLHHEEPA